MKLLLILSLVGLAMSQAIISKPMEVNDLHGEQIVYQEAHEGEEMMNERKLDKRSFGWNPWIWPTYGHGISLGLGHGHGWPSHGWSSGHGLGGWSGHGLHSGWTIGWPLWYGGGLHGGWHGSGHSGWHSKW